MWPCNIIKYPLFHKPLRVISWNPKGFKPLVIKPWSIWSVKYYLKIALVILIKWLEVRCWCWHPWHFFNLKSAMHKYHIICPVIFPVTSELLIISVYCTVQNMINNYLAAGMDISRIKRPTIANIPMAILLNWLGSSYTKIRDLKNQQSKHGWIDFDFILTDILEMRV